MGDRRGRRNYVGDATMLVYFFFFILCGDFTLKHLDIWPTLERDLTETFDWFAIVYDTLDTVCLREILEVADP